MRSEVVGGRWNDPQHGTRAARERRRASPKPPRSLAAAGRLQARLLTGCGGEVVVLAEVVAAVLATTGAIPTRARPAGAVDVLEFGSSPIVDSDSSTSPDPPAWDDGRDAAPIDTCRSDRGPLCPQVTAPVASSRTLDSRNRFLSRYGAGPIADAAATRPRPSVLFCLSAAYVRFPTGVIQVAGRQVRGGHGRFSPAAGVHRNAAAVAGTVARCPMPDTSSERMQIGRTALGVRIRTIRKASASTLAELAAAADMPVATSAMSNEAADFPRSRSSTPSPTSSASPSWSSCKASTRGTRKLRNQPTTNDPGMLTCWSNEIVPLCGDVVPL